MMAGSVSQKASSIHKILERYISYITARSILRTAMKRLNIAEKDLDRQLNAALVRELMVGVRFYCSDISKRNHCEQELKALIGQRQQEGIGSKSVAIASENDIVHARVEARAMAERIGFHSTDQIKIATAVSELARNICRYAGEGTIVLQGINSPRSGIRVVAEDSGPGIANLDEILGGSYTSKTGLGLGLIGCRRIMDEFLVQSKPGQGTTVRAAKFLAR